MAAASISSFRRLRSERAEHEHSQIFQEEIGCQRLGGVRFDDRSRCEFFSKPCVKARMNIIIAGGTGSGKTTTLNITSNFIPANERVVTIEDAAELQVYIPNLVALESRPANIEGEGAVSIRDLVRNALRMRPDRIIVGECRGGETLDMLQAMNTGHDGSLSTVHSNTPRDTISRLETLCLMSGLDLPVRVISKQISSRGANHRAAGALIGRLAQNHAHHRSAGHGRRHDFVAGYFRLRPERALRRWQSHRTPSPDGLSPEVRADH